MGKKLGLGFIGLIIVGAMYYFMAGSQQLTAQMKKAVNTELTSLEKEGFSIESREIHEEKEHFVLSFDDSTKIAKFLTRQGVQLNVNDAAFLKDFKLGVDVNYLADAYSAIAFDVYPLALPSLILSIAEDEKEKALLQKLLDKKTFLAHIAVNKLGTGFKGNMKDINEVLHGKQKVTLKMQGLTFSGDIKAQRISAVKEEVNTLSLLVDDDIAFTFSGVKSDFLVTGKTPYDYSTNYSIDKVQARTRTEFSLLASKLVMHSDSTVKDGLAAGSMQAKTKSMLATTKGKSYLFDAFAFETHAKGLDISAFEKLQEIDVNNEQEVNALLKQMMSKGVSFEIPTFSVQNIEAEGQKLNGFDVTAHVNLDKSFDITSLQANPMSALSSVDANLHVSLSKELFGMVAQIPQAMMALMLFQPKDENGKKVYSLELKDSKVTVNGMPVN